MPPFCRGYLVEGRTPEGFAGALPCAFFDLLFGCWLLLPPSALITQSKYTLRTLVFLSDVLPGAWHVDCGFVVMVISFLLKRVLPPLLLPLRHRPSN